MENIFTPTIKRVLAPLVGGSDLSYRLLCRKYGAQVTYTEMCISEYYLHKDKEKKFKKYTYEFHPTDRPLILQLAGNTAEPIITLANDPMFEGHIDGVDLNCGCPQGFALEKGYGCALLRDADKLVEMCDKIVKSIKYPFSVKMRLHDDVDTTIGIIKRLKGVGVQAFTVHGRYYWQKGEKRGVADWEALKKIRETFPDTLIVGNGDGYTYADCARMVETTGVNAAMSGYGALLNPSIFQETPAPLKDILESYLLIARQHHNLLIDVLRHTAWMLKGHKLPLTVIQKENLFKCANLKELCDFLQSVDPSLQITLPPHTDAEPDKIQYPMPRGKVSVRAKRKEERRDRKRIKKLKRDGLLEESQAQNNTTNTTTTTTTTTVEASVATDVTMENCKPE